VKARDGLLDREVEPSRAAQNFDRDHQREENEQEIEIDRAPCRLRRHASRCEKRDGDDRGDGDDRVFLDEPHSVASQFMRGMTLHLSSRA